ncbi:MAG: hypothetical protein VX236_03375 [Pseudomonadota bacterium]|nr:hypothetical protein [Pseudomonadota bacterium]
MKALRRIIYSWSLLVITFSAIAGDLVVTAQTPNVSVSTRAEGRNFIRLPELRYDFALTLGCPERMPPQSVSLSVADTRVHLGLDSDDLASRSRVEVSIDVPAAQIAPVAVEDFCTRHEGGNQETQSESVIIPSVLSAQAALTCADEERSEMTYASAVLNVLLYCERDGSPAGHSSR